MTRLYRLKEKATIGITD